MTTLTRQEWFDSRVQLADGLILDVSSTTGLEKEELLRIVATEYQNAVDRNNYIYCLEIDGDSWYVGETNNLRKRIGTHLREKNVTDIERIECADTRAEAKERERELSYEIAIEKNSTNIFGGK